MTISYEDGNKTLYKCRDPDCGHMTMVQEIERDGAAHETKGTKQ